MPICIRRADALFITDVMLEVKFIGPPLEKGPLPAVFYFALSANDSLYLDPYNQPANFLNNGEMRVFSVTLPGHDILPATEALSFWSTEVKKDHDVLDKFTTQIADYIQELIDKQLIVPEKFGVMGLSRGVFIAAYVAAKLPQIPYILGFAPLTRLEHIVEFHGMDVDRWNLIHLADKLYNRSIRFYIGNHDMRVGTENSFELISLLAETAYQNQIRSSPIELIVSPSIGRHGHGTSPEIFRQGTDWLRTRVFQ
jgi:esterase FrsA